MLWNDMYGNMTNKPDYKSVSLQRLIEDKLFNHKQTILKIYEDAQTEHNIEQKIDQIETKLNTIYIKSETQTIRYGENYHIINGIPTLNMKLNDQLTRV